jgi:hypothetical protein
MAGVVAARPEISIALLDARDKPGHDEVGVCVVESALTLACF